MFEKLKNRFRNSGKEIISKDVSENIITEKKSKISAYSTSTIKTPIINQTLTSFGHQKFISWYQNSKNLFPNQLTQHYLKASVFSPIIQELVSFFTGKGFTSSDSNVKDIIENANQTESLRKVYRKVLQNLTLTGNAWVMLAFDKTNTWIMLFNVHSINCRLSNKNTVLVRDDWRKINDTTEVETAIFPDFTNRDGILYSFLHIKDDVAGFPNYSPPYWIAGLENSLIPQKTTDWNSNRIDSGFSAAGFLLDPSVDGNDKEAQAVIDKINEQYSGSGGAGKIVLIGSEGEIKLLDKIFDMDWSKFYTQSKSVMHIDLRFPASLTGDYGLRGFSKDRGETDYNLFKPFLEDMQQLALEPISKSINTITGFNTSDLEIININPFENENISGTED